MSINLATSSLETATYSTECVNRICFGPAWPYRKFAATSLKQREVDLTALVSFSSAERAFYPRNPQQQSTTGQAKENRQEEVYAQHSFYSFPNIRTRHARHFGSLRASRHIGHVCTA
jgi:hypothetical protein